MPWPAPTNSCPENQIGYKKNRKQQNKKNYPNQPATTTSPVVSSYDFLTKYTHYTTQALVTL